MNNTFALKKQQSIPSRSSLRSGNLLKKLGLGTQRLVSDSSSHKCVIGSKRATGKTPNEERILAYLESVADYDPELGGFIVHTQPAHTWSDKVGKCLGTLTLTGYLNISIAGINRRQSHLVWLWYHGSWPRFQIDHINGVKDDDRIENLRDVPRELNNRNRKLNSNNKTGITGIRFDTPQNKYAVQIRAKGKRVHIGRFNTLLEAARALAAFHEENPNLGYTARHLQSLHRYLAAQLFANGDIR